MEVEFEKGTPQLFDKVICASHANQTLSFLSDASPFETELLSPFKYEKNIATVHSEESVMPKSKKTWSSWNYKIEERDGKLLPSTIYWMNCLQGVSNKKNYFVSINPVEGSIDKSKLIKEIDYEHPLFDVKAMKAQEKLSELNKTGPVYFCGSYFKYGFHEDAYKSAVDLCKEL